ncbi:immunoglobulin I-set domain protein [Cooperia oncophora]
MLSQLSMMEEDMRNANAAMAGELYPLAQQKATTVIQEGRDISAKEVLTYEEQSLVRQRCEEMDAKLRVLEELANERRNMTQISQELAKVFTKHRLSGMQVVPFLATHADMGGTLNEAVDFLEAHQKFIEEVMEFETIYERLKDVVENRIRIGSSFVQLHKFAKDLESSFDGITSLLDTNRDFANERVVAQVENVFRMIEETMLQEKHEVERFVASAEAVARNDDTLDVTRSTQAARNILVDHDHRYVYLKHKWAEWQANKAELKKKVTVIEEIEVWQEETWEIIRLLENTKVTTLQESEGLHRRVKELQQTIDQQTKKLEEARRTTKSEELTRRIDELLRRQREIKERVAQLEKKVETIYESFLEEEVVERIRAPQILTNSDARGVDEGSRFEFVARIEGEPEPKITWLKDGIDVKSNIDYRQDFVNGVASLVIEETFIEDTATYTVRAENIGGVAESSATLTVKCECMKHSFSCAAFQYCIEAILLSKVTRYHFSSFCYFESDGRGEAAIHQAADQCARSSKGKRPLWTASSLADRSPKCFTGLQFSSDSGLYTVRARNVHGETTAFCQLKVIQKKVPPPAPPKRPRRPLEAPTFQQTLTTTTVEEGDTAKLEVITRGEPLPEVTWTFQEQPIYQSETVKIEEFLDGTSRLIISPVTTTHTGIYTATAINEIGEARTSALLNVIEKKTVDEHMLQEVKRHLRKIARPTERTEEVTRKEEMRYVEEQAMPVTTTETKKSEKRWTELIDEQMSQTSPVPVTIPVSPELKRIATEKRWVDEIDEILEQRAPPPVTTVEEKETKTAETYVKIHEAHPPPPVQTTSTERTSTEVFNIAQVREAIPPPPVETTTTQRVSTEVFSAGQIHEARPAPKVETTTTEKVTMEVYNAGAYYEAIPPPEEKKKYTATTTKQADHLYTAKVQPTPEAPDVQVATAAEIVEREHAAVSAILLLFS